MVKCKSSLRLVAALVLAGALAGCADPAREIDARIKDFLDDLADADADDDAGYERVVDRHLHPDVDQLGQANDPDFWRLSFFDTQFVESYSWNASGDPEDSGRHGGTMRVAGTLTVDRVDGPSSTDNPRFYMKQDNSAWKIRAVYEDKQQEDQGSDGALIKSFPAIPGGGER